MVHYFHTYFNLLSSILIQHISKQINSIPLYILSSFVLILLTWCPGEVSLKRNCGVCDVFSTPPSPCSLPRIGLSKTVDVVMKWHIFYFLIFPIFTHVVSQAKLAGGHEIQYNPVYLQNFVFHKVSIFNCQVQGIQIYYRGKKKFSTQFTKSWQMFNLLFVFF